MLGVTDLGTYVLGTIAIVLLPGPNSLYVLATAAQRGVRNGYRAAFGVFLGDGVLMFASAAGVASLQRTFPPFFTVLKWAGAAYLTYMGIKLLIGAFRPSPSGGSPVLDSPHPFRRALVISLMNPKAILFLSRSSSNSSTRAMPIPRSRSCCWRRSCRSSAPST